MPALAEIQRAWCAAMRGDAGSLEPHLVGGPFSAAERLQIYRNSCRSALVAALGLAFPAVRRLTGEAFFEAAATRFALECLPASGWLHEYGAEFAGFLACFEPAASLAYLSDVARFEWALQCAATAPDGAVLEPGALAAVDARLHAALCFEFHPSVSLLELDFAADRIADAVIGGDEAVMACVDVSPCPIRLVVSRGPWGVGAERLDAPDHAFLRGLWAGRPLAQLLDIAGCDAARLLAEQLTRGRLRGFRIDPVIASTARSSSS